MGAKLGATTTSADYDLGAFCRQILWKEVCILECAQSKTSTDMGLLLTVPRLGKIYGMVAQRRNHMDEQEEVQGSWSNRGRLSIIRGSLGQYDFISPVPYQQRRKRWTRSANLHIEALQRFPQRRYTYTLIRGQRWGEFGYQTSRTSTTLRPSAMPSSECQGVLHAAWFIGAQTLAQAE